MKNNCLIALLLALPLLFASCKKDDDPQPFTGPVKLGPTADFFYDDLGNTPTAFIAPCTVRFYNRSGNATSYIWNFGDGTPESTSATSYIDHVFTEGGTFAVSLTARSDDGVTGRKSIDMVIKPTPQQALLLTARPYKLTGAVVSNQGGTTDILQYFPDCELDDLYIFKPDGKFQRQDSGVQCVPSTAIQNGQWNLLNDNSQLYFPAQNGFYNQHNILSLDNVKLVVEKTVNNSVYRYTYTAQ